jgi:hypothetical protein
MLPSLPPTEPDAPVSGIRFLTGELLSLLSVVVAWTGLQGPRSSPDWDRNRARSAVGEGLPFLLFRLQDGFKIPTMAHDSRSPPCMGPRVKRYLLVDALSANSSHFLTPSFFVRPEKPVSSPRPTTSQGRARASAVKAGHDQRPPEGHGLDGAEHAATLGCVGTSAV